MGTPLKNPPVYFTVTQVRFNALLKLADYLPSIQEGFRRAGYPAFSTHGGVAIQFTTQDGQSVPQPVHHEQFMFANTLQTHCFVLNTDSLTFQSSQYGIFDLFSKAFLRGLALVHEIATLDFTDRVGLRYLDHVFPPSGDELRNYLVPQVHGLSAQLGGTPIHSYSEAFNRVNDVQLRARVVIQEGRLAFPPDLLPQEMVLEKRFAEADGLHAILDTDGTIEGRQLFSLEAVGNQLAAIHDVISAAFLATVTEHALSAWSE